MKKIVLLGDSIRMGYDKYVKTALEGVAEVYYPSENCKFTQNVLRMIGSWSSEWPREEIDLVHWNVGGWDLLHLDEAALSTPEYYGYMIGRIDRKLRELFPGAKIVFALTAHVNESGNTASHGRYNAEIEQYNQVAIDALKQSGTRINDLYTISVLAAERGAMSDRSHYYTDEGRRLLGGQVIRIICEELDIVPSEVALETFKPENYTVEEIGS
ncbi:MAG: SGNH/GDSL hydrolase family protein [Clostridia bacterium]|nr:SGNH/GDSL hydrolase family protein [Clostridia bacterium]